MKKTLLKPTFSVRKNMRIPNPKLFFPVCFMALLPTVASAQDVAVKTNLLYDATATINLGAEVGLAPQWTAELSGNLNAWSVGHHLWKQWMLQPEVRYWLCERFSGHFFGAHLLGGQFNMGHFNLPVKFLGTDFGELKDHRRQGWMAGVGLAYGYSWILDRHWNLEAEIGLGYIYSRSDLFECFDCGKRVKTNEPRHYVGPTKAALNLIYTF